jgi:hypothetical protein
LRCIFVTVRFIFVFLSKHKVLRKWAVETLVMYINIYMSEEPKVLTGNEIYYHVMILGFSLLNYLTSVPISSCTLYNPGKENLKSFGSNCVHARFTVTDKTMQCKYNSFMYQNTNLSTWHITHISQYKEFVRKWKSSKLILSWSYYSLCAFSSRLQCSNPILKTLSSLLIMK